MYIQYTLTLKMVAVCFSITMESSYQTNQCHILEYVSENTSCHLTSCQQVLPVLGNLPMGLLIGQEVEIVGRTKLLPHS
jgi:hypothetical protein